MATEIRSYDQFPRTGQTDVIYGKSSTNSTWFDPGLSMGTRRYYRTFRRHPRRPQLDQHPGDQADLSSHQPSIFGNIYTKCFGEVSTDFCPRPTAIFSFTEAKEYFRKAWRSWPRPEAIKIQVFTRFSSLSLQRLVFKEPSIPLLPSLLFCLIC